MRGSKALAVYAAIVVVGLVAGYGLHALLAPTTAPLEGQGIATVTLQVYKNNKLIFEKKGDPALNNLLALLGELLDKDDGTYDRAVPFYRMDGINSFKDSSNYRMLFVPGNYRANYEAYPHGVIVFGEDATFRRSDYTLETVHAIQYIDEYNEVSNETGVYLTLGATYSNPATATANVTVSAVGLGYTLQSNTATPVPGYTWLLFKDVLAEPVVLQPGDSIHVRYIISFP